MKRKHSIVKQRFLLVLVLGLSAIWILHGLSGCAAQPGSVGVTTGGAKDIAYARATILDGGVPEPNSITVEGFVSEHSLPTVAPDGAGLLYLAATTAWHDDFDSFTPHATLQIGFGSTIDRATFRRPPLNLCLVIDRSGSMGNSIDFRSGTSKLEAVKVAVDRLASELNEDDLVSVVTFNEGSSVRLEAVGGDELGAINSAVDTLVPEGGTDLVAGLRRGYNVVQQHTSNDRMDRVFVFTDALLTDFNEFLTQLFLNVVRDYAGQNIGGTFFGVGTDFGQDIAYEISQIRGGNYFFLSDYERIVSVFEEDFDFLVTPVAYDVSLRVAVHLTFDVTDVFGIPVEGPFPHEFRLNIPSLFLHSREGGGAIFVRARASAAMDFSQASEIAKLSLNYETPDGTRVAPPFLEPTLPAGLDPDARTSHFQDDVTKRGVLLLNTALAMKAACDDVYERFGDYYYSVNYGEGYQRAISRLTEFLVYFDELAAGLEDRLSPTSRSLSEERALVAKLLSNLRGS